MPITRHHTTRLLGLLSLLCPSPIRPIAHHPPSSPPPSLHLIARASLSRISIMPMHPRPGKIQPQQLHQRLQRHTLPHSPRILRRTSVSSQPAHITHPHTVRIMSPAVSTHLSQRPALMHTPVKIHHIMIPHVHKSPRLMPAPDVSHTHITALSSSRTMNNNIIYLTHIQFIFTITPSARRHDAHSHSPPHQIWPRHISAPATQTTAPNHSAPPKGPPQSQRQPAQYQPLSSAWPRQEPKPTPQSQPDLYP